MDTSRKAAVAGLFYPESPRDLANQVDYYLDKAKPAADAQIKNNLKFESPQPKALIVPHAGYIYSAVTAAKAYLTLINYTNDIKRVVLIGPAHRFYFKGIALSSASHFCTPLGDIPTDLDLHSLLLRDPNVQIMDNAHAEEHSLEVQLPFLQTLLGDFAIIPIIIGDAAIEDVRNIIEATWGGRETLIIISSDLSHFEDYEETRSIDKHTRNAIESLNEELIQKHQACGSIGVKSMIRAALVHRLNVDTLHMCNSGDNSSDKKRVVGYGSWAFTPKGESKKADE